MKRWDDCEKIIQFGIPRSGSTLVYNLLREIFPSKEVLKIHKYKSKYTEFPIVATYRHPLDCVASSIQRYGLKPVNKVVRQQVKELEKNGIRDLLKIRGARNILFLRYENFFQNFDFIFNEIELFFDIDIDDRDKMVRKYSLASVKELTRQYENFSDFDPETHWHGKHISPNEGQPGYYLDFFDKKQINFMKNFFQEILVTFHYL